MKSPSQLTLTSFAHVLLQELGADAEADVQRDLVTLDKRLKNEGETFLTLTIPTLGDWLLESLAVGKVVASPSSFATKRYGDVRLPAFLSGFSTRIFDHDGALSQCADERSIRNFLQFCRTFAKMNKLSSPARVAAAFDQYIETDKEVADERLRDSTDSSSLRNTALRLFRDAFGCVDFTLRKSGIIPRHGPGSTADRRIGNAKYEIRTWYSRLDPLFPLIDHVVPSPRYWRDAQRVEVLDPEDEIPVKVISVPKTAKGPRIIAMEPTHVQYVQQGVKDLMYDAIDSDVVGSLVGFTDQTRNRRLAYRGSLDGSLATIDLSEASDRVPNWLVEDLFTPWPTLREALIRTRSTHADVNGQIIALRKFASMGSALCFPVEAAVFLTLVVNTIERALSIEYDPKHISAWASMLSVYGDDIIVPRDLAYLVMADLEKVGLVVNRKKSFYEGLFRESCGADFWAGHDVTSIRVREDVPQSRRDAESVISWVDLRNQLYKAGLWKTTQWLDGFLEKILGDYPVVLESSEYLGRHSYLFDYAYGRWDSNLHNRKVRAWKPFSRPPISPLSGPPALLKCLTVKSEDTQHLERAGRPHAVKLKRGWAHH